MAVRQLKQVVTILTRTVYFDFSNEPQVPPYQFGGYENEHNATRLLVKLPAAFSSPDIKTISFDFQTSLGETILSDPVKPDDDHRVSVLLYQQLTRAGTLTFQVMGSSAKGLDTDTVIAKTPVGRLTIEKSTYGDPADIDPNPYRVDEEIKECLTEAQRAAGQAASSAQTLLTKFPIHTWDIADAAVTGGKLAAGAVTTGRLAGGAVTTDKLGSDVRTALSVAMKRVCRDELPSDDGQVLKRRTQPYTGGNTAGSNLVTTNWMPLDSAVDVTPIIPAKCLKATVTLVCTGGQPGTFSSGEIRLRNKDDDANKVTYSLAGYNWKLGTNEILVPLTGFKSQASPVWTAIDEATIFTYASNPSSSYTIRVSNLRLVDTSVIDPSTIFLVPSRNPQPENMWDEFLYINYRWEQIGCTAVDLSDYYTKEELNTELSGVHALTQRDGKWYDRQGIRYTLDSTTACVGSRTDMTTNSSEYAGAGGGKVNIPRYVSAGGTLYSVTDIMVDAFKENAALKEITISCGTVYYEAFGGARNLTSVTLCEGVAYIYRGAFLNTGIPSVWIPHSVTVIEEEAFPPGATLLIDNYEGAVQIGDNNPTPVYLRLNPDNYYTKPEVNTLLHISEADSWEGIRDVVRMGLGPAAFPVGYTFTTPHKIMGSIDWVVRGHDHHPAANGSLSHTMTLEMARVYSSGAVYKPVQFDSKEALYFAGEGLDAGTYHFTVANQNWFPDDNGKSFQFTLTQALPAGGHLVLSASYNATLEGKNIQAYAGAVSADMTEAATLTRGDGGTDIGTTDGTGNMNHLHRAIFGSNNYAQSGLRQWLNSAAEKGAVWTPQTRFDRPPVWHTGTDAAYAGFMGGFDAGFLQAVQPAMIPCRTNGVYETASLDGTAYAANQVYLLADRFFVLSRPEIWGTWDSTGCKDGELIAYYEGLTNAEIQKYDAFGVARTAWIRSPSPSGCEGERFVYTGGNVSYGSAYDANGVAAACIIA